MSAHRYAPALLLLIYTACTDGPAAGGGPDGPTGGKADAADGDAGVDPAAADAGPQECPAVPERTEASPPDQYGASCSYMDWDLSSDGFYIVSQFGTTQDETTLGRNTSCGALQTHYAGQCCLFDIDSNQCLDVDETGARKARKWIAPRGTDPGECRPQDIPETGPPFIIDEVRTSDYWYTRRSIDFGYDTLINQIDDYYFDDAGAVKPASETAAFAHPEYFYVAGAQRFGCDAYLRVSNLETGRCIVVFADDGGPGSRYETDDFAGRRILDSSPAVNRFLGNTGIGWRAGSMVLVEWAKPGDQPGDQCEPCQSTRAMAGTEELRSPFDLTHGFRDQAACRDVNAGVGHGVHGGTPVVLAP